MRLAIFSTSLTDTEHVQVVCHRPGNGEEAVFFRSQPKILPPDSASTGKVNMILDKARTKVTNLVIRDDINDAQEVKSLASDAVVKDLRDREVRIARKSSYIEVSLNVSV